MGTGDKTRIRRADTGTGQGSDKAGIRRHGHRDRAGIRRHGHRDRTGIRRHGHKDRTGIVTDDTGFKNGEGGRPLRGDKDKDKD